MSSAPDKTISIEEQRARLESRANAIRNRLFRTMDALDTRRHQVTELGHQAKKLAKPLAAGVLGLAVIAAGTAWAIGAAMERRRQKDLGYRFTRALAPLQPQRPSFWSEAVRRVAMAGLGIAATHLLKKGAAYLDKHEPITPRQLTK